MSNFEKIAATPEALGTFLASLAVIDTPWEDAFHKTFCAECGRDNCDEKRCPFQEERDNPTWWLTAGEKLKAAPTSETPERQGDIHKTEKLFEEIKMKIMESDCTPEEAVEVLGSVRIVLINVVKQAKESLHP